MPSNLFARNPVGLFSEESVRRICACAEDLLARVGVRVACEEALDLLASYGVRCDMQQKRAYPRREEIDRALKSVRREYSLFRRKPGREDSLLISPETVHFISGAAALRIHRGGKYEEAQRSDLARISHSPWSDRSDALLFQA